jgi:hypothetical protein
MQAIYFYEIWAPIPQNIVENICNYFSKIDINNVYLYHNINAILKECFFTLGLDKKYIFEEKRKTMGRLLKKSRKAHDIITKKYDYNFNR